MEIDLSTSEGTAQFFTQFMDLASREQVTGNLYDTVVNKWIDPEFVRPSFISLCRYCKPLIQKLLADPSYHPRAFFYRKGNLEHVIKYTVPAGGNIFHDPILQESHAQQFVMKAKDEWNNIKTVWSNMLLQLYLNQLISKQLVELQSVHEILRPYIIELYNQKQPELEDVSECIDGIFFGKVDSILIVASRIIESNPEYKLYVKDILAHNGTLENLIAFEQSLAPKTLPYILLFEEKTKFLYPSCEQVVVPKLSLLWPNMFDEKKKCERTAGTFTQLLNPLTSELNTHFKKLRKQFDAFDFNLFIDLSFYNDDSFFNQVSDEFTQIVCLYKVSVKDKVIHLSFQTFRGTTKFYEKQKVAPMFLFLNVDDLFYLIPKVKVTKSFLNLWNNETIEIGGFPYVSLSTSMSERAVFKYIYFQKKDLDNTDNELLLNVIFTHSFDFVENLPEFPKTLGRENVEFLLNSLMIPFVFLTNQHTLLENLKYIQHLLQNEFNSGKEMFDERGFLKFVNSVERNLSLEKEWKRMLQELSNVTKRHVCVFYGNFETNEFDFITLNPFLVTEKVVNASLYVLLLPWQNKVYYYFLFPMVKTLKASIITDWKRGFQLYNDTESLAYQLLTIMNGARYNFIGAKHDRSITLEDAPVMPEPLVIPVSEEQKADDNVQVYFLLSKKDEQPTLKGQKPILEMKQEKVMFEGPYINQTNLLYDTDEDKVSQKKKSVSTLFNKHYQSISLIDFIYVFGGDYFLWFKGKVSLNTASEFQSLRGIFKMIADLLPIIETESSFFSYLNMLLYNRYCVTYVFIDMKVNIDLFFKIVSSLSKQSIYVFVVEKCIDCKENENYERRYIQYYQGEFKTEVLYFFVSFSHYRSQFVQKISFPDVKLNSHDFLAFLFPTVAQVPQSAFTNFLSNE